MTVGTQAESLPADAAYVRLSARQGRKFYALIDKEDFERVAALKWRYGAGYVFSTKGRIRLHAFLMGSKPGHVIDHINGDRLDNRKKNLRFVTAAQNATNKVRSTFLGKTSKFKGVVRSGNGWAANIRSDGVTHYLGCFSAEADAARAYDEAATRLHGAYAKTNETMGLYSAPDPVIPDCSQGPPKIGRRALAARAKLLPRGADPLTGNEFCRGGRGLKPKEMKDAEFLGRVLKYYEQRYGSEIFSKQ